MRSTKFRLPLITLALWTATATIVPASDARAADGTAETTAVEAQAEAAPGGMVDSWNIVQNATKSPEHKTLVQALTAAEPNTAS